MRETALGTVNNGCRAVIVWNLMLDSDRGPNRDGGCQTCYGAVDIDRSNYHDITYNSHYYIIGHLSCVVDPFAVRLSTSETENGIMCSAFRNPDDSIAFVIMNEHETEEKVSVLTVGGKYINLSLLPRSVTSLRW